MPSLDLWDARTPRLEHDALQLRQAADELEAMQRDGEPDATELYLRGSLTRARQDEATYTAELVYRASHTLQALFIEGQHRYSLGHRHWQFTFDPQTTHPLLQGEPPILSELLANRDVFRLLASEGAPGWLLHFFTTSAYVPEGG